MNTLQTYPEFLDEFYSQLQNAGIAKAEFTLDHIAYRAGNENDYTNIAAEFTDEGFEMISEKMVGTIKVGIFFKEEGLDYQDQNFQAIELLLYADKDTSGWDHAELISDMTLEEVMEKYPDLEWETKNKDREDFPMLKLLLSDTIQAKFPRRSVLVELARQENIENEAISA